MVSDAVLLFTSLSRDLATSILKFLLTRKAAQDCAPLETHIRDTVPKFIHAFKGTRYLTCTLNAHC